MKKTALVLCMLAVALTACSKPKSEEQKTTEQSTVTASSQATVASESTQAQAPSDDNAQTALDWAGDYKGVLPCADCEGIKTELELNQDKTYELTQEYLGRKDQQKSTIKGSFTFDAKNPSIIILSAAADHQKYFVGENYVALRAAETGEAITGPMADLYKLTKETP
ncbi:MULTISPECIES: copper resistance protein NlpE [unclassified Acinetobacter]|uniref:copper resistance protein NlpE n=1 Tax=unclassified Acinetobacter TaxID=196816 RepID=UPI0029345925|nr:MULTISPECIES: copper resistance protein NlpE [unclassified Acinetobacter]WOE31578.1 copper resistance protein NlpE [Acinetobacter sp. SAAs470]WOE39775.1 copper resistance protein NlpE [Acinetobacter sp. SAAs474]